MNCLEPQLAAAEAAAKEGVEGAGELPEAPGNL